MKKEISNYKLKYSDEHLKWQNKVACMFWFILLSPVFVCFLPSPYFEISIPFIIFVGIIFFRFSKKEPTQKYRSIIDVARILQDNNEL